MDILKLFDTNKAVDILYLGMEARASKYQLTEEFYIQLQGEERTIAIPYNEFVGSLGNDIVLKTPKSPDTQMIALSVKQNVQLKRMQAYVEGLKGVYGGYGCGGVKIRKKVINAVKKEIGDHKPPAASTLGRWYKESIYPNGLIAILLSRQGYKAKNTRFSDNVQALAFDVFDESMLCTTQKPQQLSTAYAIFKEEMEAQLDGEKVPSYGTFRKWYLSIDPDLIQRAKKGIRYHRTNGKRNQIGRYLFEHPLERVEADAVNLAIGICDENGNYLGTVVAYFFIDCYSRSILGFKLQVGPGEHSDSVLEGLKASICPKANESDNKPWIQHGIFHQLVVDGGTAFKSLQTMSQVLALGISPTVVTVAAGYRKPFIERFFRTFRAQCMSSIPGYLGKQADQRALEVKAQQSTLYTLSELEGVVRKWIVEYYHEKPHSGLAGQTPNEVWIKGVEDYPPMVPHDLEKAELVLGQRRKCKISGPDYHTGIQVNTVRYNDSTKRIKAIGHWLEQQNLETVVDAYYSDNDVSKVTVLDPRNNRLFTAYSIEDIPESTSRLEYDEKRKQQYTERATKSPHNPLHQDPLLVDKKAEQTANAKKAQTSRVLPVNTEQLEEAVQTLQHPPTDDRFVEGDVGDLLDQGKNDDSDGEELEID